MHFSSLESLENSSWYAYNDEPLQKNALLKPRLCDPFVLMPEDSPDGIWHLFAHTWVGIEHYVSSSGFDWKREHVVVWRGHYPFLFKEGDLYYLVYEIHDRELRKGKWRNDGESRICVRSTSDLKLWSDSRVLLSSKNVGYSADFSKPRLSRPQLFYYQGEYRLYFGASETLMYDSKQKASVYFALAVSDALDLPFSPFFKPLLQGDPDGQYDNLALGSVRVVPCSDGFGAIECAFGFDKERKKSTSTMLLLTSGDGIDFKFSKTLMKTPEKGWASRYITSVDATWRESEKSWYCYFSANGRDEDYRIFKVRESLGLLLGKQLS